MGWDGLSSDCFPQGAFTHLPWVGPEEAVLLGPRVWGSSYTEPWTRTVLWHLLLPPGQLSWKCGPMLAHTGNTSISGLNTGACSSRRYLLSVLKLAVCPGRAQGRAPYIRQDFPFLLWSGPPLTFLSLGLVSCSLFSLCMHFGYMILNPFPNRKDYVLSIPSVHQFYKHSVFLRRLQPLGHRPEKLYPRWL